MSINNQMDDNTVKINQHDGVIEASTFSPSAESEQVVKLRLSPMRYLAIAVFAVAISILWFVFTAKSVVVSSTPISDEIEIKGGFHFKWDDHLLMQAGDYRVQVIKEGFFPLEQAFTVNAEQNQKINFNLLPLPGNLQLTVEPNVNVSVLVDGKAVNIVKNKIKDISAGTHKLTVSSDNYFPFEGQIDIQGKQLTQNATIQLVPAWADVMINSEPLGAQVYQESKLLGVTPLNTQLLDGVHQLNFQRQ